jgi:hypothetical protein
LKPDNTCGAPCPWGYYGNTTNGRCEECHSTLCLTTVIIWKTITIISSEETNFTFFNTISSS